MLFFGFLFLFTLGFRNLLTKFLAVESCLSHSLFEQAVAHKTVFVSLCSNLKVSVSLELV